MGFHSYVSGARQHCSPGRVGGGMQRGGGGGWGRYLQAEKGKGQVLLKFRMGMSQWA